MNELNIFQKIQLVANELLSVKKDMDVGTGTYQYKAVSDLYVTKLVKKAEKKHGLISIPTKQELVSSEVIRTNEGSNKESIKYSFLIKMTVLIVNVDNPKETLEVEAFGHGLDSSDKGFGKASTYARKYALLNVYKIATGEDPDSEQSKKEASIKKPSDKKIAVINYLNSDLNTLRSVLNHFNIGDINDATEQQITSMYNTFKQRGKL